MTDGRVEAVGVRTPTLLAAVTSAAAEQGLDLGYVRSLPDRFGPVDVLALTDGGHVSASRSGSEAADITADTAADIAIDIAIDIAVWRRDDLVAWGQTRDPASVAAVLHQWNVSASVEDLAAVAPFLEVFDEDDTTAEIRALWSWLLDHGADTLQAVARAAHAEPALRRRLPFISYGALALLDGRVGRQTHEITFYPRSEGGWCLGFQRGIGQEPEQPYYETGPMDLPAAIAMAVAEC